MSDTSDNALKDLIYHPRSWHGQELNEVYDRKGYQAFIGVRPEMLNLFFDHASASVLAGAL